MQMYKDCKISDAAVSQWRKGKTSPRASTIKRIAEYLGVTEGYLLGFEQKQKPIAQSTDDDIKFALFGGDEKEITDAMFEEVKTFAQMVKMREQAKKKDGKQ